MTHDEIEQLRVNIEMMETKHQLHILHLLDKNGVHISYNKNGAFINFSLLKNEVYITIKDYIHTLNKEFDATDSVIMPATISAMNT